jgi:hypothetical protein
MKCHSLETTLLLFQTYFNKLVSCICSTMKYNGMEFIVIIIRGAAPGGHFV